MRSTNNPRIGVGVNTPNQELKQFVIALCLEIALKAIAAIARHVKHRLNTPTHPKGRHAKVKTRHRAHR